ncbi:MAG: hypothetical protein MUE44_08150 [Oscillatoriaceae cyanobacterium Prado104]|nr:hypothetical protein [Oscillatoriaceae cyanobacterium Prado104]
MRAFGNLSKEEGRRKKEELIVRASALAAGFGKSQSASIGILQARSVRKKKEKGLV